MKIIELSRQLESQLQSQNLMNYRGQDETNLASLNEQYNRRCQELHQEKDKIVACARLALKRLVPPASGK
jgi:hypothetical protein